MRNKFPFPDEFRLLAIKTRPIVNYSLPEESKYNQVEISVVFTVSQESKIY